MHLSVLFVKSTAASLLSKTQNSITTFFQSLTTPWKLFEWFLHPLEKKIFENLKGQYCSTCSLGTSVGLQRLFRCCYWRVQCLKLGASEVSTASWKSPALAVGNTRTRHRVVLFRGSVTCLGATGRQIISRSWEWDLTSSVLTRGRLFLTISGGVWETCIQFTLLSKWI